MSVVVVHACTIVYTRGVWRFWCECGRWQTTALPSATARAWAAYDAHAASS